MPRSNDAVTWAPFGIILTLLVTLGIAVIGGGFFWLHSGLSDVRTQISTLTNVVSDRFDRMNSDTNKRLDAINSDMNKRLDAIIQNTHR